MQDAFNKNYIGEKEIPWIVTMSVEAMAHVKG